MAIFGRERIPDFFTHFIRMKFIAYLSTRRRTARHDDDDDDGDDGDNVDDDHDAGRDTPLQNSTPPVMTTMMLLMRRTPRMLPRATSLSAVLLSLRASMSGLAPRTAVTAGVLRRPASAARCGGHSASRSAQFQFSHRAPNVGTRSQPAGAVLHGGSPGSSRGEGLEVFTPW